MKKFNIFAVIVLSILVALWVKDEFFTQTQSNEVVPVYGMVSIGLDNDVDNFTWLAGTSSLAEYHPVLLKYHQKKIKSRITNDYFEILDGHRVKEKIPLEEFYFAEVSSAKVVDGYVIEDTTMKYWPEIPDILKKAAKGTRPDVYTNDAFLTVDPKHNGEKAIVLKLLLQNIREGAFKDVEDDTYVVMNFRGEILFHKVSYPLSYKTWGVSPKPRRRLTTGKVLS